MENEEQELVPAVVISALDSVGLTYDEVVVVTDDGITVNSEEIVADDIETFIAQPVTVNRYEYEMLNRQSNIERFTFISMLLLLILIFITARRSRKITN